jgi:CRP-like cAMP-binding protein
MLRESEFIRQLRTLLAGRVSGLDEQRKLEIVRRLSEEYSVGPDASLPPECYWVPFVTGRRPVDEASYPGLGSSDHVALLFDDERKERNRCYLLYRVSNLQHVSDEELASYEVAVSLSFAGPWGDLTTEPLPTWRSRRVTPMTLVATESGDPLVKESSLRDAESRALVIELAPERELMPGQSWSFAELDPVIRERATDHEDPFTFGSLFIQQVRFEIVLSRGGVPVSASEEMIDVCDARRFGSLYRRVLEGVIRPDTRRQGYRHGLTALSESHHPWFPVILIGSDKADLYTKALVDDIVYKKRHLTDPRWLLRVGLYLELLTCIGIFEAVKDELGDLLTPAERAAYETSPWFEEIRKAVNVEGWKDVWTLRNIVMPTVSAPKAGDVSALNLLAKKKATLAFLETHHEDLKHAIRLAGPNEHNAQETWHRVFRDAERAVLRKTPAAFPEVSALGPKAAEFILWHRKGKLGGFSLTQLSSWFGDQDGLYASACNQYRASMNHVAEWARAEGLMDHAGNECVPEGVSLLAAFMDGKHVRLGQLQRRDGYAETIDVAADMPKEFEIAREQIAALLRTIPLFSALLEDEIGQLAAGVRPIVLGPIERIIVQGRPGSSLFILAEGELEVLVRQEDGHDLQVATLDAGAVFGEKSLLTGEPRSATVRSIDSAVVYEIGQRQLAPILKARPTAIDELAAIMEPRLRATAAASKGYEAKKEIRSIASVIRKVFLS